MKSPLLFARGPNVGAWHKQHELWSYVVLPHRLSNAERCRLYDLKRPRTIERLTRVIHCADCGVKVLRPHGTQKYCAGCQILHYWIKYEKRNRAADCIDCGAPIIARYNQVHCKACKTAIDVRDRRAWMRENDGNRSQYQRLRGDPQRWAKKLAAKRVAYRRLISDPVRHGELLAWKRQWYAQWRAAIREIESNPQQMELAVLSKLKQLSKGEKP